MSTRPAPTSYDHLRVLYRTLLVLATVSAVILSIGLVQFAYFEPIGENTGATATIVGVYKYNSTTGQIEGSDRSEFPREGEFAAKVDWSSLPSNLVVDARWYDSFGTLRGQVGPATPADLADKSLVPVLVPEGYHFVLPGRYTFVVERLRNNLPVEVLGRRFVRVDRT
ncbi:MAG TPA: hypothetical protein VI172_06185 [Candidatus Dormibacteraeota bacterium]